MTKEVLEKILLDHKKWLLGKGGQRADLSGADLRVADLSGANLSSSDLRSANLRGANLRCAYLRGADLRGANLPGAELRSANLRVADLCGANLRDADLRGAELDHSAWPLWCGSLKVKIDKRIAAQLVYHAVRACQSVTDDECVRRFCEDRNVIELANQFHLAEECGRIGPCEGQQAHDNKEVK